MDKGYKLIVLGSVFLAFHINIGRLYILPSCISYAIVYSGMKKVSRNYEIKTLNESAKCCGILMLMTLIIEYMNLANENIFIENPTFHIVWISACGMLRIFMMYKFLIGSSKILKGKKNALSGKYNKKAYVYMVLASVSIVISNINVAFMFKDVWIAVGLFEFCLNIWIIYLNKGLGKSVNEELTGGN